MKLSFVIPAYNEEHYIGECLDGILAQVRALSRGAAAGIEIVVVDNASTDRTADIVKKYIKNNAAVKIALVYEKEKGLVHARRAGFLASRGDLIANVDADTRLTAGWIARVVDEFSRDPGLVALSGPFVYYDLSPMVRFFTKIHYFIGYSIYHTFRVGAMLQGGNFIVRRDALVAIGGYNTSIAFYGEDIDVAGRISKIGKVKFTFGLPMYASGRRLAKEGNFTIGFRYAINYFWMTVFKKPFTKDYRDIRKNDG